jgi:hypothetical protein
MDIEHLSAIVDTLNDRFGLNLNERDQLLFDQFEQTWLANDDVVARARNNTFDNFRLVFDREFEKTPLRPDAGQRGHRLARPRRRRRRRVR